MIDEVRRHLAVPDVRVFAGVHPEPEEAQVRAGVAMLGEPPPELIVAVGGGSVIDAAKAMRLFHEHPALTLRELTLPFLDARKRVAHYPADTQHTIRLAALPTTAGTGSEVSPAAVLSHEGRKLTVNHAFAHALGARFGVAHGRANGLFLPHVLRYNAAIPRKFMPAPGYGAYVVPQKLAQAAWVLGLGGRTEETARERLFERVDSLLAEVGIPGTMVDPGVDREV